MRILWAIHLYPPYHNCGSEYVAHNLNKYLISRGHQVRVILQQAEMHKVDVPYMYEGVEVMPPSGDVDAFRWADVVCTHLDFTQFSMSMASEAQRPLVHFIHNDIPYDCIHNGSRGNYIVFNSDWIAKELNYRCPSVILHPPCDVNHYNVCEDPYDNEFITLVSLNKNKGGEQFYKIAAAMPERKFLGVIGSYDHQIIRRDLPNVTIVENTPDILSVYKKTRLLLMPSEYESWGRTATEAMCSGIPVICTPTPGLKENCAEAGTYVGKLTNKYSGDKKKLCFRDDIIEWVRAITRFDDKKYYESKSENARARAGQLNPEQELHQVEQFLLNAKFYN